MRSQETPRPEGDRGGRDVGDHGQRQDAHTYGRARHGITDHGSPSASDDRTHIAAEDLAQINVRAPASGILRRELGPDQAVSVRDDGARDPADQRKRSREKRKDQWNSNQRSDADHRDRIDRDAAA